MTNAERARADRAFTDLVGKALDPCSGLTPSAVLHIHAMLGALLHYHNMPLSQLQDEVVRAANDPAVIQRLGELFAFQGAANEDGKPTH